MRHLPDLSTSGSHALGAVTVALGMTVLGATVVGLHVTAATTEVAPPSPDLPAAVATTPVAQTAHEPPPPPLPPERRRDLHLVFGAGDTTYMKLGDVASEPPPPHHEPHVVEHEGEFAVIAGVRDRDVPAADRRWIGREVTVDGTCTARITGFALVARSAGDPPYTYDEQRPTNEELLARGSMVLAAKLDHCDGTWARDAMLPPVIVPEAIEDPELAARAREALIASAASEETQTEWIEAHGKGHWFDGAEPTVRIVRHPTTGAIWVSVHGHVDHGCGDPQANVWGLFRVDGFALVPVQLRKVDEVESIDQLIDIDGDGELEVIGTPWLGLDTVVMKPDGTELDRLSVPFIGCPC